MLTEQHNPRTAEIDKLPTAEILRLMNDEDLTVAQVVRNALPQIAPAVDAMASALRQGNRILYVGAGTSGRLAVLDAAECIPTFSIDPQQVQAVIAGGDAAFSQPIEGAEDDREAGPQDLMARGLHAGDVVVGIAASGRTPYVVSAVEAARALGAVTIGISCNAPAPLLDAAEFPIAAPVGPEVITGSTRLKAGTAQKLILNMLSTATMIQLGKVYGHWMVDVKMSNAKLVDRARRIVMQVSGVDEPTAARLLGESGKEVKTAIVMAVRGVSADEARHLLADTQGHLRRVIES